jgi:hypothetical protein
MLGKTDKSAVGFVVAALIFFFIGGLLTTVRRRSSTRAGGNRSRMTIPRKGRPAS